jgi:ABC-2 type transport system ATP-binding protein
MFFGFPKNIPDVFFTDSEQPFTDSRERPDRLSSQTRRHTMSADLPLVVRDAVKRYGNVEALSGAGLEVRPGQLVGLLGPNGAGKTTLIRAIAGRVALDRGTVQLFGRTVRRQDPRPEIGVVPQELAIYPLLTARENLEVFGTLYGVAPAALDARVRWALDWADLADRANEPTKRVSGGMKRRLNIACSLLHDPRLVLLDEPTVGVDPQSRERIYEMLAALQRAGVSIVLTTHQLEEAERRCERVFIIDRGRIVASGSVGELVQQALGASRTVRVRLRRPLDAATRLPEDIVVDDTRQTVTAPVRAVGRDVAMVLATVSGAGAEVEDLDLAGATLQDVFIALTGRELRE